MLNIFEQPWDLVGLAVFVLAAVVLYRWANPRKKRLWQLTIPVLIVLAGFGLDQFVQTDAEKIKSLIAAVATAGQQQDCQSIAELVSPQYSDSYHSTKGHLINYCEAIFSRPLVEKGITSIYSMGITGSKSQVCSLNFKNSAADGLSAGLNCSR